MAGIYLNFVTPSTILYIMFLLYSSQIEFMCNCLRMPYISHNRIRNVISNTINGILRSYIGTSLTTNSLCYSAMLPPLKKNIYRICYLLFIYIHKLFIILHDNI